MNYKLLFEMELEKNREMQVHLDFYKNDYELLKLRLHFYKKENELLRKSKGEVQPKLQQRITEIYC